MSGILYIVATPIGNLKDVTLRAIDTLNDVDIILAEDTRVSKKLLDYIYALGPANTVSRTSTKTLLLSYHQHSSDSKKMEILQNLLQGKNIALVTDAGTPGVSDPGNELIEYLLSQDPEIKIIPVPGASSLTSALSVSGFRSGNFEFIGYFPKKGSSKIIKTINENKNTYVFFDSPYRITKTIEKLIEGLGKGRRVFLAQEMTKLNERYFRGTLEELQKSLQNERQRLGRIKGELICIL